MAPFLPSELLASATSAAITGIAVLAIGTVLYTVTLLVYNVFLHPLRHYPGPLLWRATGLPYDYYSYTGKLNHRIKDQHLKYGEVIRVHPSTLSFANEEAIKDVWSHKPGQLEFPKDPKKIQKPPNGIYNILNAPTTEQHSRFRRLLSHAFSEKGMQSQEPLIRQYTDLLVDRLTERADAEVETDMVTWYNLVTFDLIGDLAFGDPFNCLKERKTHPWVSQVSRNVAYVFQKNVLRRWKVEWAETWLVDQNNIAGRMENYRYAQEKIDKRIELGGDRGDFWDRIMIKSGHDNKDGNGMSKGEMLNNASVLVLAGSETSATVMSTATYLMLKNPETLKKLTEEVRSRFSDESEITLFSVSHLKYMKAVIDETQRYFPAVPEPAVRTPPSGGGMVSGHFVPEGTAVGVHLWGAAHLPSNFSRPDDFVPERWLDETIKDPTSEFFNDKRGASAPFSLGTRNCIGKNLAYAEMRLVLAKVFWHFDFELDDTKTGDWLENQTSFGVWQKPPLWVNLKLASH